MDRKISDENLDRIAKNLLKNFALDDKAINEIAESPNLWWNVRNQIEAEKTQREKSWFFVFRPQILAFGALAILFCFGLTVLFLSSKENSNSPIAEKNSIQNKIEEVAEKTEISTVEKVENDSKKSEISKKLNSVSEKVSMKKVEQKTKFVAKNQKAETLAKPLNNSPEKKISPETAVAETKTDFIALSYAANLDSGQIVRVKVPSAMMVSLGIKNNIGKESEFVNAEVIVGDDGAARAIRFIR